MWVSIKAFFTALPEIVKLIERLGNMIKVARENGLLKDIEGAIDAAENAKTREERFTAARCITNVIGRIGS